MKCSSSKPLVIVISGLPCTGKTTLGLRIAQEFSLSFVSKDGVKESLFESLGWSDREWSKKLGAASFHLLYYFMASQLAAGRSFIVEANFASDRDTERFLALKQTYDFEPFQILCVTDGEVLFQRFIERGESGKRHPGHVDHLTYDELQPALLKGRLEPLDIEGTLVEVDTTDFEVTDYEGLFTAIRVALQERGK